MRLIVETEHYADLQHQLFRATLSDELFAAPVKELEGGLHNVLDVATGTGIWAAEFGAYFSLFHPRRSLTINTASQFPATNVIGTDLSLAKSKMCAA